MRRNLLVVAARVKPMAVLLSVLWGCGSGPEVRPEADPFGERINQCIDAPRPRSDAAHTRMVAIAAGAAVLGSTEAERLQARRDYGAGGERLFGDEAPARRSQVGAFRIDVSPVTNAQYAEFLAACGGLPPDHQALPAARWAQLRRSFDIDYGYGFIQRFLWPGMEPTAERAKHPVVLVSHEDAGFYCAWRGGRLPTEEEWERAARGPAGSYYPWGNRFDAFRANVAVSGPGDTTEVGKLPHGNTPEGVTDMGGHVHEWTSTPWPGRPGFVVVKGNGWDGRGGYGRGAARLARTAKMLNVTLGFRCAADR
ncbi:MAG: formylglycine-generating enzyme family protein [Myxococcales bacterium]|nr:formylglycine-generating enzyme family protein [Myxococcales bacterium]